MELLDRFGPPPAPAERLLRLAELRIAAHRWKIHSVRLEGPYAVFGYADGAAMRKLASIAGKALRVADTTTAYLLFQQQVASSDEIVSQIKSLLQSN